MSKSKRPAANLASALHAVLEAAFNLDAAIDGVTDQFDTERRKLDRAIARLHEAVKALKAGAP